ncbi:hypothetical protein GCM10027592_02570 [Spirosoma flavus]
MFIKLSLADLLSGQLNSVKSRKGQCKTLAFPTFKPKTVRIIFYKSVERYQRLLQLQMFATYN